MNNLRTPDYLGDASLAQELADRLQKYYHTKGFTKVKCWLEPYKTFGNKTVWSVRSNILFNANSISV